MKEYITNRKSLIDDNISKKTSPNTIIDKELLDAMVKRAIADPNNIGISHRFTYLDPDTNELVNIIGNSSVKK